ncbi:MAG: hypothetical protein CL543_13840, partial [Alcanivorax sp.]|nr:hypothetical protein [Alcanivorax sp.]
RGETTMKLLGSKQRAGMPALIGLCALAIAGCGGGSGGGGGGADPGTGGGDSGGDPGGGEGFTLSSNSPMDGAEQKADYPVVAVFSAAVDPASVDAQSFSVTAGVNEVSGSFEYSEDGSVVIFIPDVDLVDGQSYTVSLDGITDSGGEPLAGRRFLGLHRPRGGGLRLRRGRAAGQPQSEQRAAGLLFQVRRRQRPAGAGRRSGLVGGAVACLRDHPGHDEPASGSARADDRQRHPGGGHRRRRGHHANPRLFRPGHRVPH